MRSAFLILGLLILPGGCSAWRPEREVLVAPDPVIYPAPALDERYRPWIGPGWSPFRG
ncbi:hypothetical protein [Sediminicoccus sp. KRV36]|uniref:hypothetical protein n=1 Tax=Sediminicoccus sp. KRV36 TaxID=3133721 RepID=UPI00200F9423|nr:hypothetical protein [Sediminicoccus rosea]UPY35389.1 hypothetical protein LHU95_14295 [Sediminicoccus rosea]